MIEHILVAVADQESAEEQVRLCTDLARATGAVVTVFHARWMAHGRGGPRPVESRVDAERLVDDVAFLIRLQGVYVAGQVVGTGMEHPSDQIVRLAAEIGASVVLLGRPRSGPLLSWLRRAVAGRVQASSPVPVLTTA